MASVAYCAAFSEIDLSWGSALIASIQDSPYRSAATTLSNRSRSELLGSLWFVPSSRSSMGVVGPHLRTHPFYGGDCGLCMVPVPYRAQWSSTND